MYPTVDSGLTITSLQNNCSFPAYPPVQCSIAHVLMHYCYSTVMNCCYGCLSQRMLHVVSQQFLLTHVVHALFISFPRMCMVVLSDCSF